MHLLELVLQGGHNSPGAESLRGRQITAWAPNDCGGGRKVPTCHKDFLQYSTFSSESPRIRTWGRHTCFFPRAPSNLIWKYLR